MSDCKNVKLNIYIDDNLFLENVKRTERQDVLNKVTDLGGAQNTPLPGFNEKIYIGNLDNGVHKVKVSVINNDTDELIGEIIKPIVKIPYKTKMYIDNPKKNETCKSSFFIKGWSMSECPDSKINILIDDKIIEEDVGRTERQDVHEKIVGYGDKDTTPYPGFEVNANIGNLLDGKHILKIQTIDAKEGDIIGEVTKEFGLEKYKSFGYIDSFKGRQEFKGELLISRLDNE